MLAECIGHLDDFVHESGGSNKGYAPMDLDAQQMHNADSLTTILYISRTNVQHAIIVVKKVIFHMIIILKRKTIIFKTSIALVLTTTTTALLISIRRQGNHQVLMAH